MANRFDPISKSCGMVLGLALAATTGCYNGHDGSVPAAEADDGGGDDAEPSNADGPSREPASAGNDAPFRVPNEEARLLPFPVRMHNLALVTGQTLEHPMFLELYELRYQLGDHDFAEGVAPDLRWSAERMQYWVRGLKPVCSDPTMQAAYPTLLTDPRPLMRDAWGREPTASEAEALTDLQGPAVLPADQAVMTCIAVLTALDFVSI
ncbi:MAG: hypothetical protein K0V04_02910 [Deltaproteobacteria bacterium]|nr:hypothetical protein [Deltaproteobacteria bacterium]